ncbi:MAG: hypothetical protein LBM92_07010, partial [Opitutaceae bacterium]|nr:hypothetical protein [Opitutaceae bacterium]
MTSQSNSSRERSCQECGRVIYFDGICYSCRTQKERERYLAMTPADVRRVIQEIIDGIETIDQWDKVFKDFNGLLAYRNIDTGGISAAALQKEVFYPPALYRNAPPAVRDELIKRLLAPGCENANHLLQCLAMQGDDVVRETFSKLEQNPLPWRAKLH